MKSPFTNNFAIPKATVSTGLNENRPEYRKPFLQSTHEFALRLDGDKYTGRQRFFFYDTAKN